MRIFAFHKISVTGPLVLRLRSNRYIIDDTRRYPVENEIQVPSGTSLLGEEKFFFPLSLFLSLIPCRNKCSCNCEIDLERARRIEIQTRDQFSIRCASCFVEM